MTATSDARRWRAGGALAVITALLITAAAVSWYARSALVDERAFSDRLPDWVSSSSRMPPTPPT